jgi:enoyl-CoA hydratase/carnithine racemase
MNACYGTLMFERVGMHVGILTLNRIEVANAINTQMARELLEFFLQLSEQASDLRCLVVTGAGEKAFCAGGDLKERAGMTVAQWSAQHSLMERAIVAILECAVPIVAAVNGAAFGGGCELALACDFIYASTAAKFALTETRLGIIPGAGGTQTLPRAVGTRRALELICTAAPFDPQQAMGWGLVNRVVSPESLRSEVLSTARKIAANAPLAVKQGKKSVRVGMQMDLHHGLQFAIEAYNRLVETTDRQEGVRAFIEKRAPVFSGQ